MVIFHLVKDNRNMVPGMTTDSTQLLEKGKERFSIEAFILPTVEELSVSDANSAKVVDSLSGGMMRENRIGNLWRNQHPASRATLLRTDLTHSPHIKSIVMGKMMEFLYVACFSGSACAISGQGLRSRKPKSRLLLLYNGFFPAAPLA